MIFCNIVHRYGDGHAVGNAFSPNASLRSDASRDSQAIRQQISAVTQRLAEAEAALRAFDANSVSSKASASSAFRNHDTPPAASQSPSYKRFQPRTLAVDSHNADRGAGKFYDESESADSDMYASAASKDDEAWGGNDDAESTSGYTSASQDTVDQAEGQLSAMQNSILLLCDQVQDLRGKLTSSRPSSSKKSKFDELARAKRELVRVREENEALAMRCRELSLQQNPESLSEYQQVRPRALLQRSQPWTAAGKTPPISRVVFRAVTVTLRFAGARPAGSEGRSVAVEQYAAERGVRQRAPASGGAGV